MRGLMRFLLFGVSVFLIHWLLKSFFGVGLIGMTFEMLMLGFFAVIISIIVWPLLTLLKLILRNLGSTNFRRCVNDWFCYPFYFAFVFMVLLVPHLWMSHKLMPLKKAFVAVSNNVDPIIYNTGEVDPGGKPIIVADFGGKLDELIQIRTLVLIAHHYVPIGTGRWQTMSNYGPSMPMAYIYTYLPKDVYWFLVVKIFGVKVEEENIEIAPWEDRIDKNGNLIV